MMEFILAGFGLGLGVLAFMVVVVAGVAILGAVFGGRRR